MHIHIAHELSLMYHFMREPSRTRIERSIRIRFGVYIYRMITTNVLVRCSFAKCILSFRISLHVCYICVTQRFISRVRRHICVTLLIIYTIHGLYKKYREQFFPDMTIRRSAVAPSRLGGEESDLQNAPSVSRL